MSASGRESDALPVDLVVRMVQSMKILSSSRKGIHVDFGSVLILPFLIFCVRIELDIYALIEYYIRGA